VASKQKSEQILALHSNDVVFLVWRYPKEIDNCLGFSVRRREAKQDAEYEALPAWVGWQGGKNEDWKAQTTDVWPVQKFSWRDFTAMPGKTYQYQVVPMVGTPDDLKPLDAQAIETEPIPLTPEAGENFEAYFNNGILSTQHVSHLIPPGANGAPSSSSLMAHIKKPGDKLRNQLAGEIIDALKTLLAKAKKSGGTCYCALYELNDPELIQALLDAKGHVQVILSEAGTNDSTDQASREQLHSHGITVMDRMLDPSKHIGHNKFVVYVDKAGEPQSVMTGSTNWTYTALCAQSNNASIISAPEIAAIYLDYWNRLKKDTADAGDDAKALQSQDFRHDNNRARQSGAITIWFSPNTKGTSKGKAMPGDMNDVFQAIEEAKQAILFLEFEPGTPSVLDKIKEVEEANPVLFIRGAATDAKAIAKFDDKNPITTQLYHRSTTGEPDLVDETGVAATEIKDEFAYWKKELLKSPGGHAIIHDKIVVIDPLSDDCVVIFGSHNQGYKASYCNDENLVIVRGNQELARAYTTHVMDVYDHYRWRYLVQQQKDQAWTGLQTTPGWQDRYFQPGSMAFQELEFWTAETAVPMAQAAAASVSDELPHGNPGIRTTKNGPNVAHRRTRRGQPNN
jgi:phosphatidylserine/phosphatidylglycerophosphate/cardiolipin synthase-like enzyme